MNAPNSAEASLTSSATVLNCKVKFTALKLKINDTKTVEELKALISTAASLIENYEN